MFIYLAQKKNCQGAIPLVREFLYTLLFSPEIIVIKTLAANTLPLMFSDFNLTWEKANATGTSCKKYNQYDSIDTQPVTGKMSNTHGTHRETCVCSFSISEISVSANHQILHERVYVGHLYV